MKVLIINVLILFAHLQTLACGCIGSSTVKSATKYTEAVFVGRVISKEEISSKEEFVARDTTGLVFRMLRYSFEISAVYKGKISKNKIEVITGFGLSDCGFQFAVGQEYIVYANHSIQNHGSYRVKSKHLETNDCTRTRLYQLEEITELKKYLKEKHPNHS
jgi:hypothetical protein